MLTVHWGCGDSKRNALLTVCVIPRAGVSRSDRGVAISQLVRETQRMGTSGVTNMFVAATSLTLFLHNLVPGGLLILRPMRVG